MKRLLFAALATALVAGAAQAREIGRFGLALKMGECSGAFGIQTAYNFGPHWQLAAGVGGTGLPLFLAPQSDARTDSYYLLVKGYFKHLYLSTGYSVKRSRLTVGEGGNVYERAIAAQGIPWHLGYEFGKRRGFYFSTSIGFLYVFDGAGRRLVIDTGKSSARTSTAQSGPSVGMTLGYYFTGLD